MKRKGELPMEQELVKIVRIVSGLSLLYHYPPSHSLVDDWRTAYEWFLRDFAFVRAGASPAYSNCAVEALHAYDRDFPKDDFEQKIWLDFLSTGGFAPNGKGANTRNNPLLPNKESFSISRLVSSLVEYEFNIVRWASSLISSDNAKTAWLELNKIRGIGPKIAAMYLRDVVCLLDLDEGKITDQLYLQPIDIWTRRGAQSLAESMPRFPKTDWDCAEVLVEASRLAGVKATRTNIGLWLLGSQLAGNAEKFRILLANVEDLRNYLAQQIDWHQNRVKVLETVLG